MSDETIRITSDLALIVDQARWAHSHGHWKAGHGLTAEHGVDLSRTEEDRLKGPTYDLEVGDHRARDAYHHACTAVHRTDVLLAGIVLAEGVGIQPLVVRLDVFSGPDLLARVAKHATWRAEHIIEPADHRHRLSTIRKTLDRAVRGLSAALDVGPREGIAHNEKPCKTCSIRPAADRKSECDTCATYRRRNNIPRPTSLDHDRINQARAAQARRISRGEGWGAA